MTSAVTVAVRARAPMTVKPHQAPVSRGLPARLATEFAAGASASPRPEGNGSGPAVRRWSRCHADASASGPATVRPWRAARIAAIRSRIGARRIASRTSAGVWSGRRSPAPTVASAPSDTAQAGTASHTDGPTASDTTTSPIRTTVAPAATHHHRRARSTTSGSPRLATVTTDDPRARVRAPSPPPVGACGANPSRRGRRATGQHRGTGPRTRR